jgi:phosphoribosyl 1,2-cyclic phosphodiesterase
MGDEGHLSNEACAEALCRYLREIDGEKVPSVVLAHLSSENNTPAQAYLTVKNILEENDFLVGRDLLMKTAPKSELGEIIEV